MSTDPAPAPAAVADGAALSPDEPVGQAERARIRLTAIFGFLSSILVVVAWFLPWIEIPKDLRQPARTAISRDAEGPRRQDPALGQDVDVFVEDVTAGRFSGLGLFHYFRTAPALNRYYAGEEATGGESGRPFQMRRAFRLGAMLIAGLPVVALVLAVYFATHGFRRVKSPVLILMALVGCAAAAVLIWWVRLVESLGYEVLAGIGLRLTGAAAVVLALGGIFGVTSRNWWRVYAGFLATLAALVVIAWAYVSGGVSS